MSDPVCHYCKREAGFQCDHVTRRGPLSTSCDRYLCIDHRLKVGHMCKRGRGGVCESIDSCPDHKDFYTEWNE